MGSGGAWKVGRAEVSDLSASLCTCKQVREKSWKAVRLQLGGHRMCIPATSQGHSPERYRREMLRDAGMQSCHNWAFRKKRNFRRRAISLSLKKFSAAQASDLIPVLMCRGNSRRNEKPVQYDQRAVLGAAQGSPRLMSGVEAFKTGSNCLRAGVGNRDRVDRQSGAGTGSSRADTRND